MSSFHVWSHWIAQQRQWPEWQSLVSKTYNTSDFRWKLWLVETIQLITNSVWIWNDNLIFEILLKFFSCLVSFCIVDSYGERKNCRVQPLSRCFLLVYWGWKPFQSLVSFLLRIKGIFFKRFLKLNFLHCQNVGKKLYSFSIFGWIESNSYLSYRVQFWVEM